MEGNKRYRFITTKLFAVALTSFFILSAPNVLAVDEPVITTPDSLTVSVDTLVSLPDLTPQPIETTIINPDPVVEITPTAPVDSTTIVPDNVATEPSTLDSLPAKDNTVSKKSITQNTLTSGSAVSASFLEPVNTFHLPGVDLSSGAFINEYPIIIPPGRNGFQPDIKLRYNSQDTDNSSVFGYGWSVNIPYIQLINRYGVDRLYSATSTFFSSLSDELVQINTTTYQAKVENGDFLKYTYSSSTWVVTDKKGTIYKFGVDTSTQQFDASSTSHIYKWMLQEVRDTNDNFIKYEYFKDGGQIYPSAITYTVNSTTQGIFTVNFLRESRSDALQQYKTGFKVVSNYRIYEIDVNISGSWLRKYFLQYITGANGYRSLLSTISEQGQDDLGVVTRIPTTTFSYSTSTPGWTQDGNWLTKAGINVCNQFGDANGDGLQDVLSSWQSSGGAASTSLVYFNNGDGTWTTSTTFGSFRAFYDASGVSNFDMGSRVADYNGDGLSDIIGSWIAQQTPTSWAFSNTGTNFGPIDSNFSPPGSFPVVDMVNNSWDLGTRFVDLNGDGLLDIYRSDSIHWVAYVAINNGSLFVSPDPQWSLPVIDNGTVFGDVNGDGLVDIIQGTNTSGGYQKSICLNNGHGWVCDSSISQPVKIYNPMGPWDQSVDYGARISDINGDGLDDIIVRGLINYNTSDNPENGGYINTGTGFQSDNSWSSPQNFANSTYDLGVRIMDINGDGLPDILKNGWNAYRQDYIQNYVYLNNTKRASDLLISVKHSSGGITLVDYQATTFYRTGSNLANPNLPMVLNTVLQIRNLDGLGTTNSSSFKYEGGKLYYGNTLDRKFAGFNKVTKTDSFGNYVSTYYHQGDTSDSSHGEYNDSYYKINKPYRVETYDINGSLFTKNINKWDEAVLSTSSRFVFETQSVDYTYDGNASHKDKAQSFTYNTTSTGNLLQQIDWGEVSGNDDGTFSDTGTDSYTTDYTFAINTSSYILGLPSSVLVSDYNTLKVKQDRYYYDTSTIGVVLKGNMTKQESWQTSTTYINNQKIYNSYGLVTSDIDALGNTTTYNYDSYNLYPTTTTDALSYKVIKSYDYSNGKPKQVIDQNNLKYQTVFDGLDRVVAILKPDLTTTSTLVTSTEYLYTPQSIGWQIKQTDYLNNATTTDSYAYTDGLDRTIQKRQRVDDSGNYSVTDFVYGSRGPIEKESLPYFSSGSASTTATTTQSLYKTYLYDPLLRLVVTIDSVGTSTNSYDRWKLTATDANGNSKNLYKDAYDNLVKVEEINNGSTYTTNYTYNGLGNLISVTDSLSNVRSFAYDGLGRRVGVEDLHSSGDTTFGTSTFVYDNNGNLTQKVDPNKQTVNYTYDKLNRVLTEDYTGKSGTEVTYGYDRCTYGVGKFCSVTSTGAIVNNVYDGNGHLKQETKKINNVNYVTQYSYDRLGNNTNITYPDNSQVQYVYNSANRPQAVNYKENSDGSFKTLVSNIIYSPLGQTAQITYPSGVTTTFTYDANRLYRLINKNTSLPTSSVGYYGEGLMPGAYYLINTSSSGVAGGPTAPRNMTVNGLAITQSIIYDDSFEGALLSVWKYWSATGTATLDCTASYTGNCSQQVTVPTGGNVWDSQLWQDLRVDNGMNYTVKFRAKANATTTITFGINQDHSPWSDYGLATGVSITPNWKQYTYSFTSNGTDELARVFYYLGASTSTIWFDDVEVIPDGLNMIKNQSFETSMNNWYAWSNGGTGQSTNSVDCTTSTTDGGCSNKTIVNYGGQAWQVQLAQNTAVATSTTYILSFDAKGTVSTTEAVAINQNHDAYSDLSYNTFLLNPAWKTYQFEITPSQGDSNVRLMFYLGSSTNTIWFDNVHFWPKQATKITSTPQFSALYESANTSTSATNYRIQVTQSGADFSAPLWDSGSQTLSPSIAVGARTPNIAYAGPAIPNNGMKYFWRIKFWDNLGNEGAWTNGRDYFYAPGNAIQNLSYAYDKVGNITQILDNSSTSTSKLNIYSYDNLNRLLSAKVTDAVKSGDYTQTYAYDALGNITNRSDVGDYSYLGYQGSSYANPDAVTAVGTTTFSYDKNGNMTSSSASILYTWDYRNQLATSTANRVTSTYLYDQDGNRVMYRKLGTGGTTTTYSNRYYSIVGNTSTKYIFVGSDLLATVEKNGSVSSTHFVHSDQLGSTNIITDSGANIIQAVDYYPYGAERINAGTASDKRKFIGQFTDDNSLSYLNARYYDSARGQFVSQDPVFGEIGLTSDGKDALLNPQAMNAYAYAGNNPVVNKDPDGRFWWYGFYDWSGYSGVSGFMMKTGEVFGGHERALEAIQQNQTTVNDASTKYGVSSNLTNAIMYEEQSHLQPDEVLGREQLFPNVGSGGVGVMQVSGKIGKEYGYNKAELARDPAKNIDAGVRNIAKEQGRSDSTALTASRYNYSPAKGVTSYGQRVQAQLNNPNYNRNIVTDIKNAVSIIKSIIKATKK
ncbi:MAG: carbohydrate binding domain-containing protein [Patescibacteria group bacterium]|jgi:RHS repeat-associated protein